MKENENNIKQKSVFNKLFSFFKPYKWILILAIFAAIIKSVMGYIIPIFLGKLIDSIKENKYSFKELNFFFSCLFIFFLLLVIVYFFRTFLPQLLSAKIKFNLRSHFYHHLLRLNHSFYDKKRTGEIISRLINDIEQMEVLIGNGFPTLILSITSFIPFLFFGWMINQKLTLIVIFISIIYTIHLKIFLPRMKKQSKDLQKKISKISGEATEKITGIKVIKSFVLEKKQAKLFSFFLKDYYESFLKRSKIGAIYQSSHEIIQQLGELIILWIGTYLVFNHQITIGNLVTFMLFIPKVFNPITTLSELFISINTSLASTERVFEYLDIYTELDIKKTTNLEIKGKVEFKNLSFSYPINSNSKVLENISLTAFPGQIIALVGYSGSGKSTLMDLLLKFYDPSEGQILIDDIDIKNINLSFLRQNIGVVMQQSILFSGTIEENIKLGNSNIIDFEKIKEVAIQANAYDFIMNFEQGFKTIIGENGKTLSMGQRQRISLARTFLKNPKILILDEVTSALDAESEELIQSSIQKLMKNKTTFIIAHRLSTIIKADLIVVMNKGKIVEKGNHLELLENNNLYASLYSKQFKNVLKQPVFGKE